MSASRIPRGPHSPPKVEILPPAKGKRAGTFVKGQAGKLRGRRGPDRMTRDLKQGIVDAAAAIGSNGKGKEGLVGYLKMLAKDYPKQYVSLLARVIPLQLSGDLERFIGAVNVVTVPVDRYLSSEDIQRLNKPLGDDSVIDVEPNADESDVA